MADVQALWAEVMPEVRNAVTGVGVWTALNKSQAVALEDQLFVLGVSGESGDLAGHLRLQQTRTIIERMMSQKVGSPVQLRVIDGITKEDWESVKRRDAEARRLQEIALTRQRAEATARTSWETIYDQISRKFAGISNKSLPQNRAKFFLESVELILEALDTISVQDELAERNFARCIERVATYSEIPSSIVALRILEQSGKIG